MIRMTLNNDTYIKLNLVYFLITRYDIIDRQLIKIIDKRFNVTGTVYTEITHCH